MGIPSLLWLALEQRDLVLFPLKHGAQQAHRCVAEQSVYLWCFINAHTVSNQRGNLNRTLTEQPTEIFQIITSEVTALQDANLLMLPDVKRVINIEPSGD